MRPPYIHPDIRELCRTTETCLSCGAELTDECFTLKYGYCSIDCINAKPPSVVVLEQRYNAPFRDILLATLNLDKSTRKAGQRLGIHTAQIYRYMERYGITKVVKYKMEVQDEV